MSVDQTMVVASLVFNTKAISAVIVCVYLVFDGCGVWLYVGSGIID